MESRRLFDDRWVGAHGVGRFAAEIRPRLPGFESAGLSGAPASAIDPFRLAVKLRGRASFFFSCGFNAPVYRVCPYTMCVHDLNHIKAPGSRSVLKKLYYEKIMKPAIKAAEVVFTISEYSARTVREWSGVESQKIVNVECGISAAFVEEGARREPGWPYLLFVGNRKHHKNIDGMMRAFALARLPGDWKLVLSGDPDPELLAEAARLKLDGRIVFTGRIEDELLATWYRGAKALVLASKFEGFGLPIVEAMACGTPVVTSNVSSMPEVAADAALIVDPFEDQSIASAMSRIAEDDSLSAQLRARGLNRAKVFTWERTASIIQGELEARGL